MEGPPCAQQRADFPWISQGRSLPAAPAHSASRHPRVSPPPPAGQLRKRCRLAGRALLGTHAETPARLPGSLLPSVLSLCSGVWQGGSCGHDDPHPHLVPTTASPETRQVPDRLGLSPRAEDGDKEPPDAAGRGDAARLLSSSRPVWTRRASSGMYFAEPLALKKLFIIIIIK